MTNDLNKQIEEISEAEKTKVGVLRQLLDEKLNATGELLVTRGRMGGSDSFLGTVSLGWINANIMLFTQLGLFKTKVDKKGNFIVDEGTAADLRQRAPNWSRQPLLVNYLLRQPTRMFPPMLAVVEEDWVSNESASDWEDDESGVKRALRTSLAFNPLDSDSRVGLVDLRGATVFVIDGSHRWIGIAGLMELIKDGHLTLKKKDGAPTGKLVTLEELAARFGLDQASIPAMAHESMGIELIPAVVKGEDREEARRRIRSVFVHVNKSAEPPTQSEQALLDEDDGFAVVGRETAFDHPLFRNKMPGDRVNWKGTALPEGSVWLTTGKTLRDSVEAYLGKDEGYSKWKTESAKEIAVRPLEDDLETGKKDWLEYLDRVAKIPAFADVLAGGKLDVWRKFATTAEPTNRGHLLMRPLGQLILADAVGYLHFEPHGPQLSLDDIFEMLERHDTAGGFEQVEMPKSTWWGITYDAQRETMYMGGRKTASKLLRHLLHDDTMSTKDRKDLREQFADLRTNRVTGTAYNWDGKEVDDPKKVTLPPMI